MLNTKVASKGNRRAERGQMIVIVGILMPVIVAIVGLVMDAGFIYAESRAAQAAADSIALAAATYMYNNTSSSVNCTTATGSGTDTCGALAYATALGYNVSVVTVTVTHPAEASGTYASANYHARGDYVKVEIEKTLPQFFIGVVFEGASRPKVTSIAGMARVPIEFALISLGNPCIAPANGHTNADGGIIFEGSINFDLNDGAIMSNCTGSPAVTKRGGSGAVDPGDGIQTSGTCSGAITCEQGVAPIQDPLENSLPWPCSSAATGNNGSSPYCTTNGPLTPNGTDSYVLNPGVWSSIDLAGSNQVWLRRGVYVIRGGNFTVDGSQRIFSCGAGHPSEPTGAAPPSSPGYGLASSYGCAGASGGVLIFNATNEYDGERAVGGSTTKCDNGTAGAPTSGTITITGSGGFDLEAMTTGPYAHLLFWQGCDITSPLSLTGTSSSQMVGTVYGPDATVKIDGGAGWATPSSVISKNTIVSGNGTMTMNYNSNQSFKPYKVVLVQ